MRISDWSSDVCSSDLFGLADEHRLAVDPGLYAAARQTGHIRCCGDRLLVEKLLTIPRNGFSERMIAEPLDGYGNRHEFVVIDTRRRHDVGDARPPRGERPGLVERHGIQRPETGRSHVWTHATNAQTHSQHLMEK